MPAPTVVLLAAGEGTRMRSALPKVLHPICGRPMILWPLLAAREAGAERVIVVDNPKRLLAEHLPDGVEVAIQRQPRGTGDAVAAAAGQIDPAAPVVVFNGDMPLITGEAIAAVVAAHEETGAAATLASMELEDPSGYGRVLRGADGNVERVVETKSSGDATEAELSIREVNAGLYVFDGGALLAALSGLDEDNAQGELYLPDVLPALLAAGRSVRLPAARSRPRARRQRPRRPRARDAPGPAADPPRSPARGRHDRQPGEHARSTQPCRSARTPRSSPRASCAARRASARAAPSGRSAR